MLFPIEILLIIHYCYSGWLLTDTPPNKIPKFAVTQKQRQTTMESIGISLRNVLSSIQPTDLVEIVRRIEYELLLQAETFYEYTDFQTMPSRIAALVARHPDWKIPPVGVSTATGLLIRAEGKAELTRAEANRWRSTITDEIRQDMIFRVEKMLRLVSQQLNISTVDDLNYKIQQYEMGLVISASSLEEYMDTATLPKRLASLVTDFTEYKKSLTPLQVAGINSSAANVNARNNGSGGSSSSNNNVR